MDERVEMLKEATKNFNNVRVATFQGLTVDFAKEVGAKAVSYTHLWMHRLHWKKENLILLIRQQMLL